MELKTIVRERLGPFVNLVPGSGQRFERVVDLGIAEMIKEKNLELARLGDLNPAQV
jgi:hypothetical protein